MTSDFSNLESNIKNRYLDLCVKSQLGDSYTCA